MKFHTPHTLPTSSYFIEDISKLKIGDQEYETNISYNLFVKNVVEKDYEVIIDRRNFKVKDKKIDTKFLSIAHQFMEAIFPLKYIVENFRLKIINLAEIQKRIKNKDEELEDRYSGEGLTNIQNQFKNATETDEKLSEFIKQLPLIKILNFGMQKFEKKADYYFNWNLLAIGCSEWKGKIIYNRDKNNLKFEPKIDNAQQIMDQIIRYIHKNEYDVDFEEESLGLFADFKQEINYTGKTGRMKNAVTEVCIEVENKFFYEQKITLTNK